MFQKRAEYIAEIYLSDANARGLENNTQSVCHVIGLGLGVWLIHPSERQLYVDAFGKILKKYDYPYIKDIYTIGGIGCTLSFSALQGRPRWSDDGSIQPNPPVPRTYTHVHVHVNPRRSGNGA